MRPAVVGALNVFLAFCHAVWFKARARDLCACADAWLMMRP